MSNDRYDLIDFGDGRKLESLAGHLIDRPSPAAINFRPNQPKKWRDADARYDSRTRNWSHRRPWPANLDIDCGVFRMPVRPTAYGHVGLFPEQAENWQWLAAPACCGKPPEAQPRLALNLFGYTGASTMALAVVGYHVAHVDAAKPNVQATRIAAEHNGLAEAPIRYLVDDAMKFAAREVRRNRKYHTIVLDPPAYGHSPDGRAWRLQRDLWPLLENCFRLLDPAEFRLLITGHSPEVDQSNVTAFLEQSAFIHHAEAASGLIIQSGRSQLWDASGRSLDAGFYVRAESSRL